MGHMTTKLDDTFRSHTYHARDTLRRAGMVLLACLTLVTVPLFEIGRASCRERV